MMDDLGMEGPARGGGKKGEGLQSPEIRLGRPEDLEAVASIEVQSFTNPWHPDTFRSILHQQHSTILVAADAREGVIGYAVVWWVLDQAELGNLAVRGDFQGRGIGSILLDHASAFVREKGAASLFLEVRVSNGKARRLYERHGFSQISVRKGYYKNPPEDALILVRSL